MGKQLLAYGYYRYSTDHQTENSIAYQKSAVEKYCRENDIDLIGYYADEAKSGTNTDREGFRQLMAAAQRHAFDAVVVYDISRGSRDVSDWFAFRKTMAQLGVQVISATQSLGDYYNPNDFLVELISVGLGQHQVLDTRKKSIAGTAQRAKQGMFCGGVPPLGYDIQNGEYFINPTEAETVRIIFDMYARGCSYNQILDAIKDKRGKSGQRFGKNSLNSILKNERYIGTYVWNEKIRRVMRKWAGGKPNPSVVRLEGVIPAIITPEIWGKVHLRMKKRNNAANGAKREYLLSGLIECVSCGSAYTGRCSVNKNKDGSTRETRYYACADKYRTRSCKSPNVNADEIETFVVQNLKAYLLELDLDAAAQAFADAVNKSAPDASAEKRELVDVEAKIENGVRAILNGLDLPELKDQLADLRIRKGELKDIIAAKESTRGSIDPEAILSQFRWAIDHWDSQHMRDIIKMFVQKIYTDPDGTMSIEIGIYAPTPNVVTLDGAGGPSHILLTTFYFVRYAA